MNPSMRAPKEIKLGENLKRIFAEKDLKVTGTARKVGMHKSTLHGYCNGVVPRNLIQLRNLADFLGISLGELLFGGAESVVAATNEFAVEGRYEVIVRRVGDAKLR